MLAKSLSLLAQADAAGIAVTEQNWPADGFDHVTATRELLRAGTDLIEGRQVVGIGHRVVHGGMHYAKPIRLDHVVLASLSELIPLAPLHQPHNLAPIRTILDVAPHIPQIACFDTAFHRSQAQVILLKQASDAMASMGCHTNISSPSCAPHGQRLRRSDWSLRIWATAPAYVPYETARASRAR